MRAGRLTVRGAIEYPVNTPDDMGGATTDWALLAVVWMDPQPGDGREFWAIQHIQPAATHSIRARYLASVQAQMRVLINGRLFRILHVADVQNRHEEMMMTCEEIAAPTPGV